MFKQEAVSPYKNPRRLFLIDGIGAILSAFFLGVVLVKFENFFGIPASTLYFLAALPVFFAIFDFYSYRRKKDKLNRELKGIASLNLIYCILSIGLVIFHHQTVSVWGWIYIVVEVVIVTILAIIEFEAAKTVMHE